MAELHLLNIDPGAQVPILSAGQAKEGMALTPDCPDCGANRYMHETPALDVVNLRCMNCGTVHRLLGAKDAGA